MKISEFKNEPLTDFSQDFHAQEMHKALQDVRLKLGKNYPLWIDGRAIETTETFTSLNPSKKNEVIGHFASADQKNVNQAIDAAWEAYSTWSKIDVETRVSFLIKAADLMRKRKHVFSAWMILEEGKNWVEADADTAEAIDFMEFYAREMLRLSEKQPLTRIPTEDNDLQYIPLGVGAIIPPWNFPLAILVGMTTAAIVSGNCVVLKPASDSPAIAHQFLQLMTEVGLPKGVINLITGSGSKIGDHLVTHPRIRFISFTGSKEVGLRINELAAKPHPEQIWIKRIVAEMGGKDAILVDRDVNTDEVAQGIVASAFGYQGQKCSACSRAILHKDVYEEIVEKVKSLTESIRVDSPDKRETQMGPMINESALRKVLEYIEIGKKEGKLVCGGKKLSEDGYFVEPTVFRDVTSKSRLGQEEIFGPVLAVMKAESFDEGLRMANDTQYGLTGAVYSNNVANLEKARRDFHVGNLYLNRKCTGALVGVHPFGGFNMSGTDSKAGGRDYLLLFTQAKLVSKKIR